LSFHIQSYKNRKARSDKPFILYLISSLLNQ
jgi:hypothetical protein